MPRILLFFILTSSFTQTTAQDWLYAKVWAHRSSGELVKMKLLPADGGDPFFIVSRQKNFPDQHSWDWMSEEGGVLRLFSSDSVVHDSVLLISGQTRWVAYQNQGSWLLPNGDQPLTLKKTEDKKTWLLEVTLEPIDGVQSQPEPILILSIQPHSKKKNRFLIESTGNLQSIPVVLLELGITLALISQYQSPTFSD